MANQQSFEIVTPAGLIFQEQVYGTLLPTPEGQMGVLPNHAPLITIVSPGVISIKRSADDGPDTTDYIATAGGLVVIDGKQIRLLADVAERAESIDELKAKEALERARELRRTNRTQVSLADATRSIEFNLARLKVAKLRRRHRAKNL